MRHIVFIVALAGCGPSSPRASDGPVGLASAPTTAAAPSNALPILTARVTAAPSIAPSASATVAASQGLAVPSTIPVSHDLSQKMGPIVWIPDTPACKSVKSTKPAEPVPVVRQEPADGSSPLPIAVILRVLRSHAHELEQCYLGSPNNDVCADVVVRVLFTVDLAGRVSSSKPSSPDDGALGECVAQVFATLTFPRPEGGVANNSLPVRFLR